MFRDCNSLGRQRESGWNWELPRQWQTDMGDCWMMVVDEGTDNKESLYHQEAQAVVRRDNLALAQPSQSSDVEGAGGREGLVVLTQGV